MFVIFQEQGDGAYVFDRVMFWNIPNDDLEEVHRVWERTVQTIRRGVQLIQTPRGMSNDLPKQWLEKVSMQGLRVYASGENLFLLTKRKGIFPRSNIFSGYSGNADVYLPARVFTFGLNLTF